MVKYIVFLSVCLLFSCKKLCCEYYDTRIDLFIEDESGNNLMDPFLENHIDVSKANIYYLINGVTIKQYNSSLDCPSNLCDIYDQGKRFAALYPYETSEEKYPITFIQWNETDIDTVKCHYIRGDGVVNLDSVWYNGALMFPDKAIAGFPRAFKIIK